MVASIRAVEQCLGSSSKTPAASELPIRALVRRSVTLRRDLAPGEQIGSVDVALLRPGTGIPPAELELVVGKRAVRALVAGSTLKWTDVE